MSKRKCPPHQPFEFHLNPRGSFTKITHEMMGHDAWKVLNLRQRGLYLALKRKYRQKISNGKLIDSNKDEITFPKEEWSALYGDYRTWRADIDKLVEVGLVDVRERNKNQRKPNVYGFSERWQDYRAPPTATKERV